MTLKYPWEYPIGGTVVGGILNYVINGDGSDALKVITAGAMVGGSVGLVVANILDSYRVGEEYDDKESEK